MLKDIKATANVTEEQDRLGGSYIWESNIYPVTIRLAYLDTYDSGAININVIFADPDGKELAWKNCVTNRDQEDFYIDKKTKEEKTLPGMMLANSLTDIVAGKPLLELAETLGVVEIYDFKEGKDIPQEKPLLKELHGKRVVIGVIEEISDKNVQNAAGKWVPSGKTRKSNIVDKFFLADGSTRSEKAAGSPAEFIEKWKEAWVGKSKNTTSTATKSDTPAPAKRESLFPQQK